MDSDEFNIVSFHIDSENLVGSVISGCSSSEENDSEPLVVPKKIRLKVKIPPAPVKRHFCEICNKEFSSGKAYGGHVRIHYKEQSKKKTKRKIPARKRNSTIAAVGDDVEVIKCYLCGKEFNSMHSLFGHMRRHPDRSWKGIRPPLDSKRPNPLSYPAGWSSSSSSSSLLDDDDDDVIASSIEVQEAAWSLIMLSYAALPRNGAVSTPANNPSEDCGDRKMKEFDLNQPYVDTEMEAEDLRFC